MLVFRGGNPTYQSFFSYISSTFLYNTSHKPWRCETSQPLSEDFCCRLERKAWEPAAELSLTWLEYAQISMIYGLNWLGKNVVLAEI